jgi:hypothetical protein
MTDIPGWTDVEDKWDLIRQWAEETWDTERDMYVAFNNTLSLLDFDRWTEWREDWFKRLGAKYAQERAEAEARRLERFVTDELIPMGEMPKEWVEAYELWSERVERAQKEAADRVNEAMKAIPPHSR